MRKTLIAIGLVLVPVFLAGQSTMVRDGESARLATVDANKNVRISIGAAGARTFNIFFVSDPTSSPNLTVSAGPRRGFRVKRWCFSFSSATATQIARAQFRRVIDQGTNSFTVQAPMAEADGWFDGFVSSNGASTQGAMLAELTAQAGEIGAGLADYPAGAPQCVSYLPYEMPRAAAGKVNGFQLTIFNTAGAGALAAATMSMTIVLDDEESK